MEEKERIEIIGKSLLLIILTIVISIFAWFFYGVSKVNAQGQVRVKSNGSWGSWTNIDVDTATTAEDVQTGTSWASWAQVKDTIAMLDGKTYNIETEITVIYKKNSSIDLVSATDLHIYNGSTLVAMDNKCTTSVTTDSVILQKRYKYSIRCIGISGQGYYPYISIMSKADGQQEKNASIQVTKWEYHLNTDDSATNAVLNGINQATEIITNNNNQNTENITNNQNNIWQEQIEFFENQYNQYNESQKVCTSININQLNGMGKDNYALGDSNNEVADTLYAISDYIKIYEGNYKILRGMGNANSYCLYDVEKNLKSCTRYNLGTSIGTINITSNEEQYIRFTIRKNQDTTLTGSGCQNGNQALMDGPSWTDITPNESIQDELDQNEDDLADYLTDDEDLNNIDYDIDTTTNTMIWGIFSNLVTGNAILYTGVLTIMFLGVVKLILAR